MINIAAAALALAEVLLGALRTANALDGKMAYQAHAYGKIADALVETIACAIADSQVIFFDDARAIAKRIYEEAIDNGEGVAYCIDLFNEGVIDIHN
jgi:hypothetical protein